MERRSFTLAALLGGAMLAGVPTLVHAQPQIRMAPAQDLGDMLNLRPRGAGAQAPTAARYEAENVGFTFDRSGPTVRFDGAREIIVLVRRQAPMGDILYVNDLGEPVLRVSGLGGMTVFTPERPQGMPVQFVAIASPIQLEAIRSTQLLYRMGDASNRISRLMGREVGVTAPDIGPEAATLLADVLNLTVLAFQRNAARDRTKARSQRVGVVEISQGTQPDAKIETDKLMITIAPNKGVAGRPSSERIARVLAR